MTWQRSHVRRDRCRGPAFVEQQFLEHPVCIGEIVGCRHRAGHGEDCCPTRSMRMAATCWVVMWARRPPKGRRNQRCARDRSVSGCWSLIDHGAMVGRFELCASRNVAVPREVVDAGLVTSRSCGAAIVLAARRHRASSRQGHRQPRYHRTTLSLAARTELMAAMILGCVKVSRCQSPLRSPASSPRRIPVNAARCNAG